MGPIEVVAGVVVGVVVVIIVAVVVVVAVVFLILVVVGGMGAHSCRPVGASSCCSSDCNIRGWRGGWEDWGDE